MISLNQSNLLFGYHLVQQGPRPHPNEMSGSDLDGDLYFVTWREDFIRIKDNYPAMHFPPAEKYEKDGPIGEDDLIQHVKDYIKTDKKGIIARQHLINADFRADGIESEECLELAKIHSLAVDAVKTDHIPQLNSQLKLKQAPDFLGKSDHKLSYPSKRVMGTLFRRIKGISDQLEALEYASQHTVQTLQSEQNVCQIIEDLHSCYCRSLTKLKNQYGIQNECKLWRGEFPRDISTNKKKNLKKGLLDLKKSFTSK